tara:strand:+ start:716 stop:1765 length:1050 start_codon:yes stop_codon:yes gene_type:complete
MIRLRLHSNQKSLFRKNLLGWYDINGRSFLPWKVQDIYKIWISEIMLQQTQVQTVIPYYERFISKYPTLKSLSTAGLNDILELWSGLGFYRRAENIYKTVIKINRDFNGAFPKNYEDILSLPGIGRTTASAIITFSGYDNRSILDGNVKRFLSRLSGSENESKSTNALWDLSEDLLSNDRAADCIQAYMDIGSLVCRRLKPSCEECPVNKICKSYPYETTETKPSIRTIPQKRNIWAVAIVNHNCDLYLEKISYDNLWKGLYSSPIFHSKSELLDWVDTTNLKNSLESGVWKFSHNLSHIKFTFNVMVCNIKYHKKLSLSDDNWYNLSNIDFGIPKYQNKIFNKLKELS